MRVRGYAAHGPDQVLEPFEFDRRSPGAKDVEIRIEYCGICHSDIHFARNEWGMSTYPCVPGHEIVGRVTTVGSRVIDYEAGDLVGVGCLVNSCRICGSCKEGLENFCERGFTLTYGSVGGDGVPTYGGYSTHIVVDEDFVVRVPDGLDAAATAPLLCAGITTYSPLRHVGLSKGDRIAVLGLGGLGHMAVKLAHSMEAEVAVFSRSPSKEAGAKSLGADHFILTAAPDAFNSYQGHFDFILNTVGAEHDLMGPLNTLRRDGTMIMVGAPPNALPLPTTPLRMGRRTIMGSLIGGLQETQEMLDYCADHGIVSEIERIGPTQIKRGLPNALWPRT